MLLLGIPALPLPTAGATHVFETIAALLALQLIANRDQIWLPRRWRNLKLAGDKQQRFMSGLIKMIRWLERFSRPRLAFLFDHRLSNIVFGLLVTLARRASQRHPLRDRGAGDRRGRRRAGDRARQRGDPRHREALLSRRPGVLHTTERRMSTSQTYRAGPVLFCSDGSGGSRAALAMAAELLVPRDAVVLSVWETIAMRLMTGGFYTGLGGSYIPNEGELDAREEATAREAAEEGARAGREQGWDARARTEQAEVAVWTTVIQVADEIDASLIVCGARGLNPVERTILGSVSEAVLHHSHRPTLISPQPASTTSV